MRPQLQGNPIFHATVENQARLPIWDSNCSFLWPRPCFFCFSAAFVPFLLRSALSEQVPWIQLWAEAWRYVVWRKRNRPVQTAPVRNARLPMGAGHLPISQPKDSRVQAHKEKGNNSRPSSRLFFRKSEFYQGQRKKLKSPLLCTHKMKSSAQEERMQWFKSHY